MIDKADSFADKINKFTEAQEMSGEELAEKMIHLKEEIMFFGACIGPRNPVFGALFLSFDHAISLLVRGEMDTNQFLAGIMHLFELTCTENHPANKLIGDSLRMLVKNIIEEK